MVSKELKIRSAAGFHMRPAGLFSTEMQKYHADVLLFRGETVINAKSIMSILSACIQDGDTVVLQCSGSDEEKALARGMELIESGMEG